MKISLLFRLTGAAVGLQLAIGGLVTFGYIGAFGHIIMGVIVAVLALVALVYALRLKPRIKPLVGVSIGVLLDVFVQAILGFATLGTSSNASLSNALAYVHFLNALAIFGMALSGTFMSMRAEGMAPGMQGPKP
ncbi:MAG TPA: hypothetical protein VLY21_00785 [Nitrososphaerales archaeon]|nr:hypothetical protein [Nitrososphaerales archaeon]